LRSSAQPTSRRDDQFDSPLDMYIVIEHPSNNPPYPLLFADHQVPAEVQSAAIRCSNRQNARANHAKLLPFDICIDRHLSRDQQVRTPTAPSGDINHLVALRSKARCHGRSNQSIHPDDENANLGLLREPRDALFQHWPRHFLVPHVGRWCVCVLSFKF
jgi:hypothetical protein